MNKNKSDVIKSFKKKIQLLKKEGIQIKDNKVVDFKNKLYQFK